SRGDLRSATYCNTDSCRCCNNTYNSYRITRESRNDVWFITSRFLKVDHIATTSKASYYNFTSVSVWDVNRSGFSSSDNTKTTNGYISNCSQCISVIYFINEDTTTSRQKIRQALACTINYILVLKTFSLMNSLTTTRGARTIVIRDIETGIIFKCH